MLKLAICVVVCATFIQCQVSGNPIAQNDQAPYNGFGNLIGFPFDFVNSAMGGMGKMTNGLGTAVSGVSKTVGEGGHNVASMITSAATQGADGITKRIAHVFSDVDGKRTEKTFEN